MSKRGAGKQSGRDRLFSGCLPLPAGAGLKRRPRTRTRTSSASSAWAFIRRSWWRIHITVIDQKSTARSRLGSWESCRGWTATPSPRRRRDGAGTDMSSCTSRPTPRSEEGDYCLFLQEYKLHGAGPQSTPTTFASPFRMAGAPASAEGRSDSPEDKPEYEEVSQRWKRMNSMVPLWQRQRRRGDGRGVRQVLSGDASSDYVRRPRACHPRVCGGRRDLQGAAVHPRPARRT